MFIVTKFVSRGTSDNSTYIPENSSGTLVYIPAMPGSSHILIVDDHREIRDLVARALTKEGFRVSAAADGRAMRKILADSRIDLVLLDLMLPGEDGLSLCRTLRAESNIPIIMLTAKGDEVDRVIGLEMGADDYLPKPFGSRELVARIKAVLRRSREKVAVVSPEDRPKRYHFDRWDMDTGTRELLRADGVTISLSTGEYDLLITFVERPQRVLSRDQLLDLARGRAANALDRSIDTQVSRLRKKLELDASDPKIIKTVWGGGYIFTPSVSRA
jgi:two-component system OmpR family response regulator